MTISAFVGQYEFLSNFYVAPICYGGKAWMTSEHLYQAMKSLDRSEQEKVRLQPTASKAKRMGRTISIRPDWDNIKIRVMRMILQEKFKQYPNLAEMLKNTAPHSIVEGNNWHDNFWGACFCGKCGEGQNHLGKLLEEIRGDLK